MKLATRTTELPAGLREQVDTGWHVMVATIDQPDTWCCVELRRLDGDRLAGPLVWHPHPRRAGVDLDEWITVDGWEYVQSAHRADQHPGGVSWTEDLHGAQADLEP